MESDADKIAVANRWIEAYNAQDMETMNSMLGEDLRIQHHNRGFDDRGREAMLGMLRAGEGFAPDKRFHSIRRQFVSGDRVVTEHVFEATFTMDIPGFAEEGETVKLDLCSIWEIRDGKIVEYDDYG